MTETSTDRFFPYCSILISPESVLPSPEKPCLTCLKIHIFLMKFMIFRSCPFSRGISLLLYMLGEKKFCAFLRKIIKFCGKYFFILRFFPATVRFFLRGTYNGRFLYTLLSAFSRGSGEKRGVSEGTERFKFFSLFRIFPSDRKGRKNAKKSEISFCVRHHSFSLGKKRAFFFPTLDKRKANGYNK